MRVLNSLSDLNILRILHLIWRTKKISRVEIASLLKMDKSTVTKIISELAQNDLVHETESGASGPQGGRKPVFLEINGGYACTGGIEINPERMYVCLEDLQGTILYEFMQPVDAESYEQSGFIELLKTGIGLLEENAARLHIAIAGIGLGVPGLVDVKAGTIIQSIPLLIEEPLNVQERVYEFSKVPFFLENDARCCCYTEQMVTGLGSNSKNMMYVLLEHRPLKPQKDSIKNISVGLGLILNGRVYHGANSFAGEFRSMLWQSKNQSQFLAGQTDIPSLECEEAKKVFAELSQNIAFLANTLTLDVVYIGGIDRAFSEELVKLIREQIVFLWPYQWNKTTIVSTATISRRAVCYGAASMVLDKLFSIPDLNRHEPYSATSKTPPAPAGTTPYKFLLNLRAATRTD